MLLKRMMVVMALASGFGLLTATRADAAADEGHAQPHVESADGVAEHPRTESFGQHGGRGDAKAAGGHAEGDAHAGGSHAGGADGDHHEPRPLVPALDDPQTFWSALWVLIIFVVMLAILYPTAWKNVLKGLKAREQRIRTDIAEAEAARGRAEQTLKEYNTRLASAEQQVRDLIAKATAEGEAVAGRIRTQAQQDAEESKEKAARDIEAAKTQAIAEVQESAAVLATAVAEKILRRNLKAEDQRDLVSASLDQLQTVGRHNGNRR